MSASDELRARLRRLRREEPREPPERPSTRAPEPPVDLVQTEGPLGTFDVREVRLAPSDRHGEWHLGEIEAVRGEDLARLARDPALADVDLGRAVYLDVETTGLSGGAGTVSFLVALGWFASDRFHLWQGFLRGPEDERALLADVARRVGESSCLVSFFGKSFDRHRLEDKMRLHGVEPPFEGVPHLDLYHPLARLYRAALPDGRLQTMERALCGVRREDDLPGSFAPEAWFDFLAGRAHRLEEVFQHNRDDVLSLVVLAAHLGRVRHEERADGRPLGGPDRARAEALARLAHEAREVDEALAWLDRAVERAPGTPEPRELGLLRADLLRRRGDAEDAARLCEELAAGERDRIALRALVELAKLEEHRLGAPERAAAAVERARCLAVVCTAGAERARHERELEHRAERLARKVAARA
jgi:uncharacterized protein YprB with RNaseH-like and TPR domain